MVCFLLPSRGLRYHCARAVHYAHVNYREVHANAQYVYLDSNSLGVYRTSEYRPAMYY